MSLNSQSLLVDPTKSTATATHTQIDGSRLSDDVSGRDGDGVGVGAPVVTSRNMSTSSNPHASDKRRAFRKRVGIPEDGTRPPQIDLQWRRTRTIRPHRPLFPLHHHHHFPGKPRTRRTTRLTILSFLQPPSPNTR
jgi:hypothetical protein